ncbi:hypothetical protein M885DRAFT_534127 [Pelagophyceae sp. CCMP2097]|nr:hypothetical protein M885DRAFT_534127 [Pelagophyceae sp. CCMP2097]
MPKRGGRVSLWPCSKPRFKNPCQKPVFKNPFQSCGREFGHVCGLVERQARFASAPANASFLSRSRSRAVAFQVESRLLIELRRLFPGPSAGAEQTAHPHLPFNFRQTALELWKSFLKFRGALRTGKSSASLSGPFHRDESRSVSGPSKTRNDFLFLQTTF